MVANGFIRITEIKNRVLTTWIIELDYSLCEL